MGFVIFCVLMASNMLHLTARLPALGSIRFDLLLAIAAVGFLFLERRPKGSPPPPPMERETTRRLLQLIAYIALTLPLVRWPGSVIDHGAELFFRAVIYYFLIVGAVRTQKQLGIFLILLGACQVFRVLEPLYLHVVDGYWGASTNMGNWESMDRLSGAPNDIINPNGLAYVVVSTLPLLFFAQRHEKWPLRLATFVLMGSMIYTLALTGSRSGFLVLVLLLLAWVWTSKRRALSFGILFAFTAVVVAGMSEMQRYRYLSIFESDVPGAATAQGRLDGVVGDFRAAMERPLFGHGLGTSSEVNANIRGGAQISHDLYAETTQELGFIGLFMFLRFVYSALRGSWQAATAVKSLKTAPGAALAVAAAALPVLMATNLIFSFASYGLSEYQWYLLAGLGVVTARLVSGTPIVAPPRSAAR